MIQNWPVPRKKKNVSRQSAGIDNTYKAVKAGQPYHTLMSFECGIRAALGTAQVVVTG
jgi:hypothetical protein